MKRSNTEQELLKGLAQERRKLAVHVVNSAYEQMVAALHASEQEAPNENLVSFESYMQLVFLSVIKRVHVSIEDAMIALIAHLEVERQVQHRKGGTTPSPDQVVGIGSSVPSVNPSTVASGVSGSVLTGEPETL